MIWPRSDLRFPLHVMKKFNDKYKLLFLQAHLLYDFLGAGPDPIRRAGTAHWTVRSGKGIARAPCNCRHNPSLAKRRPRTGYLPERWRYSQLRGRGCLATGGPVEPVPSANHWGRRGAEHCDPDGSIRRGPVHGVQKFGKIRKLRRISAKWKLGERAGQSNNWLKLEPFTRRAPLGEEEKRPKAEEVWKETMNC